MRKIAVALAVGLVLLVSGVALASIPDGNGVIHGCYLPGAQAAKVFVLLDSRAPAFCEVV